MKRFLLFLFLSSFLSAHAQQFAEVSVTGLYPLTDWIDFEPASDTLMISRDTGSFNLWQIGSPQKNIFSSALSQNRSIVTDTTNTYSAGNRSSFTVGCINYYSCWGTSVQFSYSMHSSAGYDGGMVELSRDNGLTWHNIIHPSVQTSGPPSGYYSLTDTVRALGEPGFSGITAADYPSLFLPHLGSALHDTLLLRFTFASDSIAEPGDGWMIDNIGFSAGCDVSVSELNTDDFRIFPNPAVNKIYFTPQLSSILTITDLSGRLVRSQKATGEADISDLENGIYFVQLISDSETVTSRLLVNHGK